MFPYIKSILNRKLCHSIRSLLRSIYKYIVRPELVRHLFDFVIDIYIYICMTVCGCVWMWEIVCAHLSRSFNLVHWHRSVKYNKSKSETINSKKYLKYVINLLTFAIKKNSKLVIKYFKNKFLDKSYKIIIYYNC